MIRVLGLSLAAAFWLLLAAPVRGVVVDDLYEAQVPVADRGGEARQAALGEALGVVAAKVSGRRDAGEQPAVVEAAREPGRFVQQYQYRNVTSGDSTTGLALWVRFDPLVVEALVREAGLPVWGRQRPTVLAWVAVDGDGGRRILSADDTSGLALGMQSTARSRGIPVVVPLMDLEDQIRLTPADLWAGYDEKVAVASERYSPETVLVARALRVDASSWEGRFELVSADGGQRWTARGQGPAALLDAAMEEVSDRLAARYAGLTGFGGTSAVTVRVFGVSSISAYARTIGYLSAMDQVDDVAVTGLGADELRLSIAARGGGDALRSFVRIGTVLDILPSSSVGEELHLRLRP